MSDRTWHAYQRWASTYNQDPNPHTTLERPKVFELLAAAPGERVLDAACGTGYYASLCVRAGCTVVGLDFSPAMLALARYQVPAASFVLGDLRGPLPFPGEVFDAVICAQALKHLSDLNAPIAEFLRILKPGGRCVASVTHPDMDWSGYELRDLPSLILSREAEIFPHQRQDYREAFARAGFVDFDLQPVTVSETIRHLLKPEAFRTVEGRSQIAVLRASRPA